MEITTKRLKIFPLNYAMMTMYLANNFSFEDFLKIQRADYQIHEELVNPLSSINLKLLTDFENYWYQSLWVMIEIEKNIMVGSFMLKGKLKVSQEIEIGYGTEPAFMNQGYMTEALGGFIKYIKESNFCKSLLAETLNENDASHQVLIKNGFVKMKTKRENLWWRKKINF
jgi:[ribosomal protein S5]-alanine N-acetyltransferase